MSDVAFSSFLRQIGLRQEIADKLWAGNIKSPQELASSTTSQISGIVDDNLLINTILPVLQKYAFPITMAKDPYERATSLLRREAGYSNGNGAPKSQTRSDTTTFTDANTRVPPGPQTNGSGTTYYSLGDEDAPFVFVTGDEDMHIETGPDGTRINSTPSQHNYGNSQSINITGGTFVQSSILSKKPTVYYNTNSTISASSYMGSEEEQKNRRQFLASSPVVIQGMKFSSSEMQIAKEPDYWLDDIDVHPASEEDYNHHFADETIYPVHSRGRSRALIINNIKFSPAQPDRVGAHVDSHRLKGLWEQLGFDVQLHENKSKAEILQVIKEFTMSSDNSSAPMSMVYIGSHGEQRNGKDYFIGIDKGQVEVNEVCDLFSSSKCPMLARKPKLFFFQFCRTDNNSNSSNQGTTRSDAVPDNPVGDHALPSTRIFDPLPIAQNMADMLLAHATAPGTKAYRDTADGSWFVTALCKVLKEHAQKEDLLSMLTMVNSSVMLKRGDENRSPAVQMAEFKTTLNKKVMFYPQGPNQ